MECSEVPNSETCFAKWPIVGTSRTDLEIAYRKWGYWNQAQPSWSTMAALNSFNNFELIHDPSEGPRPQLFLSGSQFSTQEIIPDIKDSLIPSMLLCASFVVLIIENTILVLGELPWYAHAAKLGKAELDDTPVYSFWLAVSTCFNDVFVFGVHQKMARWSSSFHLHAHVDNMNIYVYLYDYRISCVYIYLYTLPYIHIVINTTRYVTRSRVPKISWSIIHFVSLLCVHMYVYIICI